MRWKKRRINEKERRKPAFPGFMNSVHTAILAMVLGVGVLAAAGSGPGWVVHPAKEGGAGGGKRVVLLSGDEEYRSEEALPMLSKILSQRHGFHCTVLFSVDEDGTINPNRSESLGGSEALDEAELVVMALRFRKWPDEAMARFDRAIRRGVPVVALRTSTHAFRLPAESAYAARYNRFGRDVLGEGWVSHWGVHGKEAALALPEPGRENDPLLRGVSRAFGDSDVYEVHLPADAKVLMRGQVLAGMKPYSGPASYRKKRANDGGEQDVNDPMMPIAWTREVANPDGGKNWIFTTTMGAATDLADEQLRRLVVNAVYQGLGLEVPERADVTPVGEYVPTPFAFEGFVKGRTAADHALPQAP